MNIEESPLLRDLPHNKPGCRHRYSLLRIVRSICEHPDSALGGLEGEVHQELKRRAGERKINGVMVPHDILCERRNVTTATGSGAITTDLPRGKFVDVLRNKTVLGLAGAFVGDLLEPGHAGNVGIPKKESATTVSWVSEGIAPSDTNLTMGQIMFTPSTVTATTALTRTMWRLGTPDFEELIKDDLATSIGVEIDRVGVNGTGNNNQPLGLVAMPNINNFQLLADVGNGGAPAYTDLVELERIVGAANADAAADARLAWITSPNGRSKLRRTDIGATATGRYAWRHDNTMLGSRAFATSSVPINLTEGSGSKLTALVYGNFADLFIQLFSAVDLLINPFKQSVTGTINLSAYQDVSIAPRHYESFVRALGMVTT